MLNAQEMLEMAMKKSKKSVIYIIIPYMDEMLLYRQPQY